MTEAWIEIGAVKSVNPARRELRILAVSGREHQFESVTWLRLAFPDGAVKRHRVETVRVNREGVIVMLAPGVPRDAVAEMKGASVVISEEERRPRPDGLWEPEDLLGLQVKDEQDRVVGVVSAVASSPAHDILEVELKEGGTMLLPVVDHVVIGVDLEQGTLRVGDIGPYAV
jgi:16S rRNA processing protein RimM